jgi:hypothetical protein
MFSAGLAGVLALAASAGAVPSASSVQIDFEQSNCLQLPLLRQIRFFVQLANKGDSAGAFRTDVHFAWLGERGGWKVSPAVLDARQLRVGAHARKLFYVDLHADRTKIVACGLRISASSAIRRIRALKSSP